jgi:hypothetical protein
MRSAFALSILFILSCNSGIDYPEGGYDYVKDYKDEDTNFYFLPIRDSFSSQDSFWHAYSDSYLYPSIKEPNLSLRYMNEDVFRLEGIDDSSRMFIIIIKKNKLIVKKDIQQELPCETDLSKLNEKELLLYNILKDWFPIYKSRNNQKRQKYLDSLVKLYPELNDAGYYLSLLRKTYCEPKINYLTHIINITSAKYKEIIKEINLSGFWKMPVRINSDIICNNTYFDLQANTAKKYNYVRVDEYSHDPKAIRFSKACQKIIDMTKVKKKIGLSNDTINQIDSVDSKSDTDIKIQEVNLEPIVGVSSGKSCKTI